MQNTTVFLVTAYQIVHRLIEGTHVMENKDFRRTTALYGGDIDRVHITRTSTGIIRMGKIDTGFGHMDGVTSTKCI